MNAHLTEWTKALNENAAAVMAFPMASNLDLPTPAETVITSDEDRWDLAADLRDAGRVWVATAAAMRVTLGCDNSFSPINPDNSRAACEIGAINAVGQDYLRLADYVAGRRNGPATAEQIAAGLSVRRTAETIADAARAVRALA